MSDLFRKSSAIISPCGLYRYRLTRTLDGGGTGRIVWVMLNPSKADDEQDDPTIRRVIGYSRLWGYSVFDVVNLFAWRSTDPDYVPQTERAIGPDNDRHIAEAVMGRARVVVAWGAGLIEKRGRLLTKARATAVLDLLAGEHVDPVCLGVTSKGMPRHPLMVRADAPVLRYAAVRP